eukprot:1182929-Amorphochlora_amoeboformis.AAC.2
MAMLLSGAELAKASGDIEVKLKEYTQEDDNKEMLQYISLLIQNGKCVPISSTFGCPHRA